MIEAVIIPICCIAGIIIYAVVDRICNYLENKNEQKKEK